MKRHGVPQALLLLAVFPGALAEVARGEQAAALPHIEEVINATAGNLAGNATSLLFKYEPVGQTGFQLGMVPQAAAPVPPEGEHEEINNGQDPSRPVRRFDLRYQHQQPDEGLNVNLLTLRMDWPIAIAEGWKLNTRIDLPFAYSDVPSADNPNGDHEAGVGDVLVQALLIRPLNKQWAVFGGLQAIFPTASQDQFGSGSMRLLPTIGARWAPDWMPKGWWVAGLVRYDFDVWKDDNRESTSDLILEPVLNIALPEHWFVTISPEFKYSLIEDAWFLPIDFTVGKMLTPKIIASVEFKHELYDEYPQYDWAVEFRIGFFF